MVSQAMIHGYFIYLFILEYLQNKPMWYSRKKQTDFPATLSVSSLKAADGSIIYFHSLVTDGTKFWSRAAFAFSTGNYQRKPSPESS